MRSELVTEKEIDMLRATLVGVALAFLHGCNAHPTDQPPAEKSASPAAAMKRIEALEKAHEAMKEELEATQTHLATLAQRASTNRNSMIARRLFSAIAPLANEDKDLAARHPDPTATGEPIAAQKARILRALSRIDQVARHATRHATTIIASRALEDLVELSLDEEVARSIYRWHSTNPKAMLSTSPLKLIQAAEALSIANEILPTRRERKHR